MHTWNLHVNGGLAELWNVESSRNFTARVRERWRGEINLATIDWFWDEYTTAAPRVKGYLHYRPTLPLWVKEAEERSIDDANEQINDWIRMRRERCEQP